MALKRPAGLPQIDARAPEGTPEREEQKRRAACLVTPFAGGRPMGYLVGSQMQEAQNDVEWGVARILKDRRQKPTVAADVIGRIVTNGKLD